MDFYDRLKAFIESEKLKVASFEAKMRFSNGSLSKAFEHKRGIGSDRLETIFSHYPYFNAEWLFKGKGEMSNTNSSSDKRTGNQEAKDQMNQTTSDDLRKTIAALEKVVYYNELLLDEYRNELETYKIKDQSLQKRK